MHMLKRTYVKYIPKLFKKEYDIVIKEYGIVSTSGFLFSRCCHNVQTVTYQSLHSSILLFIDRLLISYLEYVLFGAKNTDFTFWREWLHPISSPKLSLVCQAKNVGWCKMMDDYLIPKCGRSIISISPFAVKSIYFNSPPLEVVFRYRDSQLQVGENICLMLDQTFANCDI